MHGLQVDLLTKNAGKDEFYNAKDFFLRRKRNLRIPDKHKIRLVLDSLKNSLSINQVWENIKLDIHQPELLLMKLQMHKDMHNLCKREWADEG